ncbi:hypothetical protein BVRB_003200 isoform A [Beta vulgaris subsp. vulgaris]|uniref:Remorin C-terminal domain-containing protein n=1 Tax=Beta vulgaris subsp. vulgaris TaxID=3555 RepID=A0A0J8B837_BETVV|nr:hypothetical protein BVRB_003200 isoform A [Beta vulgaris subsp. vulgaris]
MANSKLMSSRTLSGTFPSPETPLCGVGGDDEEGPSIGLPKGWSSERVPRSSYRSRRYVAAAALMPFSSGRTLPSKWEDAERWISSPVSLGNISTNSNYCYYGGASAGDGARTGYQIARSQRRAKSKSGPLGPVGPEFYGSGYNSFSPVLGVGVINGGRWRNSVTIEPSGLASGRFEERFAMEGGGASEGGRRSCPGHATHWLDSWSGPTSPTQVGEVVNLADENNESMNNANVDEQDNSSGEPELDRAISRRDMATQMFPDSQSSSPCSAISTPKSSISTTSPCPILLNDPKRNVVEFEVRDVQMDKQVSATTSGPFLNDDRDYPSNSSAGIVPTNKIPKSQKEEAKINAWEDLQRAKAEAALQKLEDKLEKKRASSMEKIIKKLQRAEIKSQKMRSSLSSDGDQTRSRNILKTASKIPSFCKKFRLNSSTRSCSTCYPF